MCTATNTLRGSRVTLIPDPSEEGSIDWTSVLFVTGDHSDWDTAQACYPALPRGGVSSRLKQQQLTATNGEQSFYYMSHLCADRMTEWL